MNIVDATKDYEQWLGEQLTIVDKDLKIKHRNMASDPFIFLRATYYRWAMQFPKVCDDIQEVPNILSIGDLHIENFGTWRDSEGRLIWGVNDLDEIYELPYTHDLVRLATSAQFAIFANHLEISFADACLAILKGYSNSIESGGEPFVLSERHPKLRAMAMGNLRDPVHFWQKLDLQMAKNSTKIPKGAQQAIEALMPEKKLELETFTRIAGQGSLGRQRFVAVAEYLGGRIAREAKALCPSACVWAQKKQSTKIHYQEMIDNAVRCKDPYVQVEKRWVVRRLAPDCSRIELSALPQIRDEKVLLEAMGFETGNIHLATPEQAKKILRDLKSKNKNWLAKAVKDMVKCVRKDWRSWREHFNS